MADEPWDSRPLAASAQRTRREDPADTEPAWDSGPMAALRDVDDTQPNVVFNGGWDGGNGRPVRRPERPARRVERMEPVERAEPLEDDEPWDGVIRPAQSVSWDELRPDEEPEYEYEREPEPQFAAGGLLGGGYREDMAYPNPTAPIQRRDPRAADSYGGLMR